MERSRTVTAQAQAVAPRWPAAGFEPGLFGGDHLRSQERFVLESASLGNGLWQWRHVLAEIAGMDAIKCVATTASSAVASVGKTGCDPAFSGDHRQRFDARCFRGDHTGPNPTDRSKKGCKRHVITDAQGVPLIVQTGPANEPDGKRAIAMLDQLPAVAGQHGRPRRKPKIFQGDAAYGTAAIIQQVLQRGIRPLLAPYGNSKHQHGSGLGKTRYVVERTLSWFGSFRRLKLCYERTPEHLQAFHELAASLICFNRLSPKRN